MHPFFGNCLTAFVYRHHLSSPYVRYHFSSRRYHLSRYDVSLHIDIGVNVGISSLHTWVSSPFFRRCIISLHLFAIFSPLSYACISLVPFVSIIPLYTLVSSGQLFPPFVDISIRPFMDIVFVGIISLHTCVPSTPSIRGYHLPPFYSRQSPPIGLGCHTLFSAGERG